MEIVFSDMAKSTVSSCALEQIKRTLIKAEKGGDFVRFFKLTTISEKQIEIHETDERLHTGDISLVKESAESRVEELIAIGRDGKITVMTEREFLQGMLDNLD